MQINIDNPERSHRILDVLMTQDYPSIYGPTLLEWLSDIRRQIIEGERTERYKDTWRRIPSFPKYEINGIGHIRHRDDEDMWVQPMPDNNGHVRLQKSRGTYVLSVKQLIEEAFPEIKA
ncbi:HNH endonuclease [Arthrobacter phage Uzumaki]|nr:HNH endonuclease [Arthrobacter phage Uzumaki]